jgi:two-component system, OmpR family, sensor histidine kinase BaeS
MLSKSLVWKLTLAFLLVAITTAALVAVFIRITSADRLSRLIIDQQRSDLQSSLAEYYAEKGSWTGISDNWQQIRSRVSSTIFAPPNNRRPGTGGPSSDGELSGGGPGGDRRRFFGLADIQGTVIVPNGPSYPIGSSVPADVLKAGTPVISNGKQVGTILVSPLPPPFNPEETLFLQRTTEALLYAVAGSMVIALLIGLVLARTLIRPLQALTQAAQNIAQGDLDQQVKVNSKDEIGQLGQAFNRMSAEVARVNELRRQMTADIAHDLRTPLTVIAGYVESMRDGVLQPTPERLSLIYAEIERLQNLVGDLKMLSQVDAGELPLHPHPVTPKCLLERVAAPFQHQTSQRGIDLLVEASENLPWIRVDEDRMMQVFGNLIHNSMRYTPVGGNIILKANLSDPTTNGHMDHQVVLTVEDNGEGIEEEELPYIFNRFHRADKSRHAESGESGLGLAIVKALVEAHGGTVDAESVYREGTAIHIHLPGYEGDGEACGE